MTAKHVRVTFHLNPENEQGVKTETVWAAPVDSQAFRIANSPFYVFGISSEDVVSVQDIDGVLMFQSVLARGGHSTYRVFLQHGRTIQSPEFKEHWSPISVLGATFENANDHFISVDIPPSKDIGAIYEFLDQGEQKGIWVFEEGHYGR